MVFDSFILLCYFIWFSSDKISPHWPVNHCVAQPGSSASAGIAGMCHCAQLSLSLVQNSLFAFYF